MKTIPSGLVNCGTLVFGVRIVRKDATVLAYTQHDADQTVTTGIPSTVLLSNPSFTIQSLVNAAGLGVNNTDIYVTESDDMTRADILAGVWDGAEVFLFRYNWKLPTAGIIPVVVGSFGNFAPMLGQFKVEFRDVRQPLQQNTTWLFQEDCRWRLGDARCTKDLTAFTFAGVAVTSVTSQSIFVATALTQPDDTFGEGFLTWTTGENAGLEMKISSFILGIVTLSVPAIKPINVADTFTIVAGCRKRKDEDCKTKFDNVINHGGESDKPTRDELIKPGVPG